MVKEQKRQREIVAMRAEARKQLSNGRRLCDMSDELKGDRATVLWAMRNDLRALKHASEELRGDREIVLEAVKKNAKALSFEGLQPTCAMRACQERRFTLLVSMPT